MDQSEGEEIIQREEDDEGDERGETEGNKENM